MGSVAKDFISCVQQGSAHFFSPQELPPGGTGDHAPASYFTESSLRKHTIYAPVNLQEGEKLPLLVWANGAGMSWGLMFSVFLQEIASHGYVVVAAGDPKGKLINLEMAGSSAMLETIKWATSTSSSDMDDDKIHTDIRAHIDTTRIALAGQSKGGLDTYAAAASPRYNSSIKSIGLFNSGLVIRTKQAVARVSGLAIPVFYFIGGPKDVAYKNAEKDWQLIPKDLPAWYGNFDAGHMGTYYRAHGGHFARAAVDWLDFTLKNDQRALQALLQYEQKGWKVRSQNL